MIAEQQIPTSQDTTREEISEQRFPRGAEILIEALLHEGVDSIFGYPGGAVLHIYDELWRARDRITHYLVRHEQGAVHMAEGYARVSGRVGVVLVTSGPGATNAVTGIANAYLDSTGSGYGRHHAALRQTQLSRARRARFGRGSPRSLSSSANGKTGTSRDRHSEGRVGRAGTLLKTGEH
jgi:hypothetical protein